MFEKSPYFISKNVRKVGSLWISLSINDMYSHFLARNDKCKLRVVSSDIRISIKTALNESLSSCDVVCLDPIIW